MLLVLLTGRHQQCLARSDLNLLIIKKSVGNEQGEESMGANFKVQKWGLVDALCNNDELGLNFLNSKLKIHL